MSLIENESSLLSDALLQDETQHVIDKFSTNGHGGKRDNPDTSGCIGSTMGETISKNENEEYDSDEPTLALLDNEKLFRVHIFLWLMQFGFLVTAFSGIYWSDCELRDVNDDDVLRDFGSVSFYDNLDIMKSNAFLYLLQAVFILSVPMLRVLVLPFPIYIFYKYLTLDMIESDNDGFVTSDNGTIVDENSIAPWRDAPYFKKFDSATKLRWAQKITNIVSQVAKLQMSPYYINVLLFWVASTQFDLPDPDGSGDVMKVQLTIKMMDGFPIFNFALYPMFVSAILLNWQLVRWLQVFRIRRCGSRRTDSVDRTLAFSKENENDQFDGSLRSSNENDDNQVLSGEAEMVDPNSPVCDLSESPLLSSSNPCLSKENIHHNLQAYTILTVVIVSYILIFLAGLDIYEVKYSGDLTVYEEGTRRSVGFFRVLKDAHAEDTLSSPFYRDLPGIVVSIFGFVIPTIVLVIVLVLEAYSINERDYSNYVWYKKLVLGGKLISITSCEVPIAVSSFMWCILSDDVTDLVFDGVLVGTGFFVSGTAFLLLFAIFNNMAAKTALQKKTYLLFI
mmetsp:Transcript_5505/g.7417  ORF Transcript_5505/g.7417 Transcript_5505/m.7417 type:complete len:563 (-) Transcript_5505:494-2182(-)|eukprot:CAMPEP_0116066462 /NCGR_PEP_ID=MMETSP0322-20121206/10390_1 /TAXON_ID=163516 /ORGANISM="Leptocylindrus danicus var. apora, Strain B651" /LENGTH=562 /DNA_ID=CAMNT_0003553007 /DNA_START=73 /DNA_END=1761 /DNA_ORIENTATION=-